MPTIAVCIHNDLHLRASNVPLGQKLDILRLEPGNVPGNDDGSWVHVLWIVRSELALIIVAFACGGNDQHRAEHDVEIFWSGPVARPANIRIERPHTDVSTRDALLARRTDAPDRQTRKLNLYQETDSLSGNLEATRETTTKK